MLPRHAVPGRPLGRTSTCHGPFVVTRRGLVVLPATQGAAPGARGPAEVDHSGEGRIATTPGPAGAGLRERHAARGVGCQERQRSRTILPAICSPIGCPASVGGPLHVHPSSAAPVASGGTWRSRRPLHERRSGSFIGRRACHVSPPHKPSSCRGRHGGRPGDNASCATASSSSTRAATPRPAPTD